MVKSLVLSFRELESFTCPWTACFFPLNLAGISSQVSCFLKSGAQFTIHLFESPGKTMTYGSCLPASSSATHIHGDVQLSHLFNGEQGPNNRFAVLVGGTILIVVSLVDYKLAATLSDANAGSTGLAATGGNKFFSFLGRAHGRMRLDRKWSGLLGGVRVFSTAVNAEFGQHAVS